MPELPEVESVARALRAAAVGRRLTGLRARWAGCLEPSPRAVRRALLGKSLRRVGRRGKYLLLSFTDDEGDGGDAHLMVHLRMTGQLLCGPDLSPDKHVRCSLDFDGLVVHFRDMRKFGRLTLVEDGTAPACIDHVGPDMLAIRFAEWRERIHRRRAPLKAVLLDQGAASGVGNIYADESLFRARLHPLRAPADLDDAELRRLFLAVKGVLRLACEHGGTTFLDFQGFTGRPGNFRRKLRVFQRTGEPCRDCGAPIERLRVAGRSTHFCPVCQPADGD